MDGAHECVREPMYTSTSTYISRVNTMADRHVLYRTNRSVIVVIIIIIHALGSRVQYNVDISVSSSFNFHTGPYARRSAVTASRTARVRSFARQFVAVYTSFPTHLRLGGGHGDRGIRSKSVIVGREKMQAFPYSTTAPPRPIYARAPSIFSARLANTRAIPREQPGRRRDVVPYLSLFVHPSRPFFARRQLARHSVWPRPITFGRSSCTRRPRI